MIKKGVVSTINTTVKKARVLISDINYISSELSLASYIGEIQINDNVLVAFYDNSMMDGIIIGNLSRDTNNTNPETTTYIHNQISPSSEWVIIHNIGRYPSVTITDSGGNEVIGDIKYVSENEIKITFSAAFSGKAYLN